MEWHVRPSPDDLRVWEVWLKGNVVARGTVEEVWDWARKEARAAKGQAHIYYRLRDGIRESVDYR